MWRFCLSEKDQIFWFHIMQRQFRRTTVITIGLLAFLAGLGLSKVFPALEGAWVWICLFFLIVSIKRLRIISLIAVVLFGLCLGWWRGSQFVAKLTPYMLIDKQKVVLQVKADTDGVYSEKSQLGFEGTEVHIIEPFDTRLPGKVKIEGFGEQAVYRGDIIQAEGKFFPTRGSRQGSVSFADLKVLGRGNSLADKLRLRFTAGMESALPEPLASFALGLLIGQRTTIPEQVNKQLTSVGLTHIVAVSGYNLTIIVMAMRRFGKKRSKYQITALSVLLIIGFLLVTGFSASIVRAAIVSTLSLLAWYYGRTFRPLLLLALTAVITAGWNPLYLWSDVGWYLSFLAFYGVIVLVPLTVRRFYNKEKSPRPMALLVFETFAAQLMTAPLVLYIFGVTSTVALISNLLIVPLVPIAMLLAFVAGLAGMLFSVLAGWLAWPAKILLTYMLDVVSILSHIPHAAVERSLSLISLLLLYLSLIFISFVMWRKVSKNANITEIETLE